MDTPEQPSPRRSPISNEAIIGTGITVGALGVLLLLLGWAQWMRLERDNAIILLAIGGVLFVVGGLTSLLARSRKGDASGKRDRAL